MGKLAVDYGVPVPVAFFAGILTGLGCGLLNGLLITMLRLPPFIVTLGTWSIFAALITLVSQSATIRAQALDQFAPFLKMLGSRIPIGGGAFLMYGSIVMLAAAALIWYLLSRTAFGRHVYAIGDDPNAARLSGIQVNWTLLRVYSLTGLLCGIAGWILIGRVGATIAVALGVLALALHVLRVREFTDVVAAVSARLRRGRQRGPTGSPPPG